MKINESKKIISEFSKLCNYIQFSCKSRPAFYIFLEKTSEYVETWLEIFSCLLFIFLWNVGQSGGHTYAWEELRLLGRVSKPIKVNSTWAKLVFRPKSANLETRTSFFWSVIKMGSTYNILGEKETHNGLLDVIKEVHLIWCILCVSGASANRDTNAKVSFSTRSCRLENCSDLFLLFLLWAKRLALFDARTTNKKRRNKGDSCMRVFFFISKPGDFFFLN